MRKTRNESFGRALTELRAKAAITQAEFAARLGVKQQTVSRWEQGLARPREKELPAIAGILGTDQNLLFEIAGYTPQIAVAATFDRLFPVHVLSPDSYERFCADFLDYLYRSEGGVVHRAGASGHRQDGIDIVVTGAFGTHTFQCKRVEEFGPARVQQAIAKHTLQSDRKFLLLSNIASPRSRAAASDKEWDIWDREDISRKIRMLPVFDQKNLVDTFFRGQREALLGVPEAGPWMMSKDFFGPYLEEGRLFTHKWDLVGRVSEVEELNASLEDETVRMVVLIGAPGGGKTRLVRHIVEELETYDRSQRVLFLSPTEQVGAKQFDQLGDGRKLLVVDDAHDRDDLGVVLQYCSCTENRARLLLATRPYGREAIRYESASFGLSGQFVREIELQKPSKDDAKHLAAAVLANCEGPVQAAAEIAAVAFENPLVTVIGAQLVAREKIHPVLLGNVRDFQTHVLSKFQDVIAGEFVSGLDSERTRGILRVISLVQPVLPDEPGLLALLKEIEQIEHHDSTRLLRTLAEAGVLFRRGLSYRISPDLLADSIISSNCILQDGTSNGYVERVFDQAQPQFVRNLLVNLGKLDWRKHQGNTADSRLLRGLWQKLQWQPGYSNPHVEAAAAVAYYQPKMALEFARRLIADGHGDIASVCEIVKNAAYNADFLEEACELLWIAGRGDGRALHQHPRHGIRILKELAEFEPGKPADYISRVVEFAIGVLGTPGALDGAYTPFEILEGALQSEGHSTVAVSRRAISMSPYTANRDVVSGVRDRVISELFNCLEEGSPQKAFLAASALSEALRGPSGMLGLQVSAREYEPWQIEHEGTIRKLKQILAHSKMHPVVLVRAAESISWHAFHGPEAAQELPLQIIALLDRDLDTRFVRALMDSWGCNTWPFDEKGSQWSGHENALSALTSDLQKCFATSDAIRDYIDTWLKEIVLVAGNYGAPTIIVNRLIDAIPGLAKSILESPVSQLSGPLNSCRGMALSVLFKNDFDKSRKEVQESLEASPDLLPLVAEAYSRLEPGSVGYSGVDVDILRTIFRSRDLSVLRHTANITLQVTKVDKRLALDLICSVDLASAGQAAHGLFMWLCDARTIPKEIIGEQQWRQLLASLESLPKLDDHWVQRFLKNALTSAPADFIELLKRRLGRTVGSNDWSYRPLEKTYNRGPGLGLQEVESWPRHLNTLLAWGMEHASSSSCLHRLGQAISGLSGAYRNAFLDHLLSWASGGTVDHAKVVSAIIREAQNDLIFEHPTFVRSILCGMQIIGADALSRVGGALYAATISGMRSTTPGEPFPEDVRLEQHAQEVLRTLGRHDPAFPLFSDLLRTAQDGIARQLKERRAIEAEEQG